MTKLKKDLINTQGSLGGLFGMSRFNTIFDELYTMMDRAWTDFDLDTRAFMELQPKTKFPKINVAETENEYEVVIAISGFDREDLSLEFKEGCLFIKADKSAEIEDEDKKYLTREISNRSFRRTIKFPVKIESSSITSSFDENKGLVVCKLPKLTAPEPDVIKIDIK